MKFQLVLWILGRKLLKKAKKDTEFQKKISEKNCTVQIKTADNSRGRFYTFNDGKIVTEKGVAANPTVALVFKDAATGFTVLKSGKTVEAVQNGSLKLEGDGGTALWFSGVAKEAK